MNQRKLFLALLALLMTWHAAGLSGICCPPAACAAKPAQHCSAPKLAKPCCAVKPMSCCQVRQGNCNTQPQPPEDRLSTSDRIGTELFSQNLFLSQETIVSLDRQTANLMTRTLTAIGADEHNPPKLYIFNRALLI